MKVTVSTMFDMVKEIYDKKNSTSEEEISMEKEFKFPLKTDEEIMQIESALAGNDIVQKRLVNGNFINVLNFYLMWIVFYRFVSFLGVEEKLQMKQLDEAWGK